MRNIIFALSILALLVAVYIVVNKNNPSLVNPQIEQVILEKNRFIPNYLNMNTGDTIKIINKDGVGHRLTYIVNGQEIYLELPVDESGKIYELKLALKGHYIINDADNPQISLQIIVK